MLLIIWSFYYPCVYNKQNQSMECMYLELDSVKSFVDDDTKLKSNNSFEFSLHKFNSSCWTIQISLCILNTVETVDLISLQQRKYPIYLSFFHLKVDTTYCNRLDKIIVILLQMIFCDIRYFSSYMYLTEEWTWNMNIANVKLLVMAVFKTFIKEGLDLK